MSMFQPNRIYTVTVFDNQNRNSREQFVAVNFEKMNIPIGKQTRVPGRFLSALENKGSYLTSQMEDLGTGQVRSDPYARWMPRFSITTHGMADIDGAPAVPAGGVVLEAPKPMSVPILGQQQPEPGDADESSYFGVEDEMLPLDRSDLQTKHIAELRKICTARGIKLKVNNNKEEIIDLLVGEEE